MCAPRSHTSRPLAAPSRQGAATSYLQPVGSMEEPGMPPRGPPYMAGPPPSGSNLSPAFRPAGTGPPPRALAPPPHPGSRAGPPAPGPHAPMPPAPPTTKVIKPDELAITVLPDDGTSRSIDRVAFTNTGAVCVALDATGTHRVWRLEQASEIMPASDQWVLMTSPGDDIVNDLPFHQRGVVSFEGTFQVSRNDSYILSTSGGSTSLFNLVSFQRITSFYKPPPAAVSLGFHPRDNNLIALGLEDGFVALYNAKIESTVHKVPVAVSGKRAAVTGLGFSAISSSLVVTCTGGWRGWRVLLCAAVCWRVLACAAVCWCWCELLHAAWPGASAAVGWGCLLAGACCNSCRCQEQGTEHSVDCLVQPCSVLRFCSSIGHNLGHHLPN
jgi:hypothetical protein